MNVVSFAGFAHLFNDDSSLALLALLAGMAGGWTLIGYREQLRERRARAAASPRKA